MTADIKKFWLVAKPGIICGNLITAAGGFFLASGGVPKVALLLPTILGISLVVASACVFNNFIDRRMDRKMARTRNRVLAQERMSPKVALSYASLLAMAGIALLWVETTLLSVAITLAGFMIYVGVYSLYLKRQSVYGTLVGSLAGAAPPLAAYCAVTDRIDLGALMLLTIFCLWQIPHSYAVAIFRFDEYAAAAIPVLPVKQGLKAARKHISGYILAFTGATLMLTFGGYTGYGYLAVAAVLGLSWFCMACTGSRRADERRWAKQMFAFSLVNIFILSVMMSIDCTVTTISDMLLTYAP